MVQSASGCWWRVVRARESVPQTFVKPAGSSQPRPAKGAPPNMRASYRSVSHLSAQDSSARWHVLVDFDGTIAPDDPTDRLLEQFAHPAWRDIEAAWQAGRISSRECMARHAELLRATPDELDAAIRAMRIDPTFHAFVAFCRRRRVDLTIVSHGFDRVVRILLECEGLTIPFFANGLEWQVGDRWSLAFPHTARDCRSQAGNCKCSHGACQAGACVVIGDGRSDFCMAQRADYVIAKDAPAQFCRERGLQHASFTTFDDVEARLARWLARRGRSDRTKLSLTETQPWGRRT